jgi:putative transposase
VRKAEVRRLKEEFCFSQRHACELVGIPRSTYRYEVRKDDTALRQKLIELAHEQPRYGYRRLCVLLRIDGTVVNHKRVRRVYRAAGLQVKRIRRRRLSRNAAPFVQLTAANQEWALDFASDVTASGRRIRVLSVIDVYTRMCLALETDTSFPSRRVTRVLEAAMAQHGKPATVRSDNGPELTSRHYLGWFIDNKIAAVHIQPGRPMQNGHVESFHGRLRDECLNTNWFANLWDARRKIGAWQQHYNTRRPHSKLGYRTPEQFAQSLGIAPSPSPALHGAAPALPQGQALRAPAAALTKHRRRANQSTMAAKELCEVV